METCQAGGVSVAANGRAGRRVACILDGHGTTMEILDLEEMEVGPSEGVEREMEEKLWRKGA